MQLTSSEVTFLNRVAETMVTSPDLTMEEAMQAVLKRDEELWLMVATKSDQGRVIASEMASDVYRRIRG